MRDLQQAIAEIERNVAEIERLEDESEKIAKEIAPQIIGRRVKRSLGRRNALDGEYEISRVSTSYRGTLHAHGYKIVVGGGRGSQVWDLGWISYSRLLPAT